ncbi:MAG: NAD-dependent epimerase/dehydratase family protein [Thermomicrobiales bacterium]
MNILIIGGTGFIGPHVVRQLAASGHALTLYNRGNSDAELPDGVTHISGDRANIAGYVSRFRALRPDVVLDMRALVEADARRVVDTITGIAPRLVTISSLDVYRAFGRLIGTEPGPPELVPFDESAPLRDKRYPYRGETPPPADDPRAWSHDYDKIPIEQMVMATPGISGTILRLPLVYGDNDYQHRLLAYVQRFSDNRPAIILGEWEAEFRATRGYVGNVAAAIALAVTDDRARTHLQRRR